MKAIILSTTLLVSASSLFAQVSPQGRPKVIYTPIVLTGQSAPGLNGAFASFPVHSVINDANQVLFLGATHDGPWPDAIFVANSGGITLVAKEGQDAPDYPAGTKISGIDLNFHRVNNPGQVTFESSLSGPGLDPIGADNTNAYGNWFWSDGQLHRISRQGTHAPGTPDDVNVRSLGRTTVNDLGQVAYAGDLIGASVNGNNDSAFFFGTPGNIQLLAREGNPAPGGLTYGDMQFDFPVLSPRGNVAFLTGIAGGPYSRDRALFAGTPDNFAVVARTGQPAPGTNATFDDIHAGWNTPRINDRGEVMFVSTLNGDGGGRGVWAGKPGQLTLVARTGQKAPGLGDSTFDFFYDIDLSAKGDVAFRADFRPADDYAYAIYAGRPNHPELVAATGQQAPGAEPGVVFGYLTDPVINKDGQVAFFGYLTGENSRGENDYGIFATGHNGDLRLIARFGDEFAVHPGDIRSIAALSHDGVYGTHILSFNAQSDLVFMARFTDGSEGIFTATVLPEPGVMLALLPVLLLASRRRMP